MCCITCSGVLRVSRSSSRTGGGHSRVGGKVGVCLGLATNASERKVELETTSSVNGKLTVSTRTCGSASVRSRTRKQDVRMSLLCLFYPGDVFFANSGYPPPEFHGISFWEWICAEFRVGSCGVLFLPEYSPLARRCSLSILSILCQFILSDVA